MGELHHNPFKIEFTFWSAFLIPLYKVTAPVCKYTCRWKFILELFEVADDKLKK